MLTNKDLNAITEVLRKELVPIKKKLKKIDKIEKNLEAAIRLFDNDLSAHDTRITRLEMCCNIVADEDR